MRWLAAVTALLAGSGCARIREVIGFEHGVRGPAAVEVPTSAFVGIDRVLRAPGETDGSFEHLVFPDSAGSRRLAAGASAVLLDHGGPGVIRRIRLTLANTDLDHLRRIALRMYWDGETLPSVDVPLGDFFGNAFERRPYASLAMGLASGGFYSYLPMPFAGHARIVIENGSDVALEGIDFDADVDVEIELSSSVATFHAAWSRDARPRADRPHVVADIQGSGWFVGTSLSAQGYDSTMAFLQGAGRFRIDGRTLPATSTGDYLSQAGGAQAGALAAPFLGAALRDKPRGRLAAYRWHLADPIPFRSSLRLELERGRANREAAEYATVAYWYQTEPHDPLRPLPHPSERKVPEVVVPADATFRDDLELIGTGEGTLRLTLRAPRRDRYAVVVYPEASPGSVALVVSVRGQPGSGRVIDVSRPGAEPGDVLPGVVVDTVAVIGQTLELELAARGGGIALPAAFHLDPVRRWAEEWSVVGPWPDASLDWVRGPELNPDLERTYPLTDAVQVGWRPAQAGAGVLRLASHLAAGAPAVAYAQTFLWSPTDRSTALLLGAEGAHVLWVNGERVSEGAASGALVADEIEVPAFVRAGWNAVLAKVAWAGEGWALTLRAADPTGELSWAARPDG